MSKIFIDVAQKTPWHTLKVGAKTRLKKSHLINLKNPTPELAKKPVTRLSDIVSPANFWQKTRQTIYFVETKISFFAGRGKELVALLIISLTGVFVLNTLAAFQQSLAIKNTVITSAYRGFSQLVSLATSPIDLKTMAATLSQAQADFKTAQSKIWFFQKSLGRNAGLITAGQNLISAGHHLANVGQIGLKLNEDLKVIIAQSLNSTPLASITGQIKNQFSSLDQILNELSLADADLSTVPPGLLPKDLQAKFQNNKAKLELAITGLKNLTDQKSAILEALGDPHPQRYLILLANNNERRPIMGFLGSLMLVDLNDGRLTKSDFFDVYHFDGQITEQIPVPAVFQRLTGSLGLRDSNYSPDYPKSAQSAANLLEKGGGPGVDAVITVDLEVIRTILKTIGPITIDGLDEPITADNFDSVMSLIVEAKQAGAENPKIIIPRFAEALKNKIDRTGGLTSLIKIIPELIKEKHVMAYAKDADIQNLFNQIGLTGQSPTIPEKEDYLNIVHTSISGNKSDKYVTETINHQTFVEADGSLYDQLTIERTHNWNESAAKTVADLGQKLGLDPLPDLLTEILGRGQNISHLRLYVPKNSQFIKVIGGEDKRFKSNFDDQINKTYFEAVMKVLPGKTSSLTVVYKLPYKLDFTSSSGLDDYLLTIAKQPGSIADKLTKQIVIRPGLKIYKSLPALSLEKDTASLETDLRVDRRFGVVVGE